jgi:Cytochrome C oxidase, cbb3-type, subunit III
MKRLTAAIGIAVWLSYMLAGCVEVAATDVGKKEFESKCAACHGSSGKGDGPQATLLATKPADLTILAKRNGGVFPAQRVHEIIDGRFEVAAHGPRTMPVWGMEFELDVRDLPKEAEQPLDYRETTVRNRIQALVDYLSRLQHK